MMSKKDRLIKKKFMAEGAEALSSGMQKGLKYKVEGMLREERDNVYGFKRPLLNDPVCIQMMNSAAIKKADVRRFDLLFQALKKRKNKDDMQTAEVDLARDQLAGIKINNDNTDYPKKTGDKITRMMPFPRDGHTGVVHDG